MTILTIPNYYLDHFCKKVEIQAIQQQQQTQELETTTRRLKTKWTMHKMVIAAQIIQEKLRKVCSSGSDYYLMEPTHVKATQNGLSFFKNIGFIKAVWVIVY